MRAASFHVVTSTLVLILIISVNCMRILDTSVSCDQNEFLLNVRFEEPFRGIIYSEKGFPNCVHINASIISQSSYAVKVPLNGCETSLNEEGNLENAIVIQESVHGIQASDKKYLLTCIPASLVTRETMAVVNFGGVTVRNSFATPSNILRGQSSFEKQIKYSVQLLSTDTGELIDPLSTPLTVGDPITYVIRVPVMSLSSDARIGRCWAKDSSSFLDLSDDNGCSLQLKGDVWRQFERIQSSQMIVFKNKIKAWAFPTRLKTIPSLLKAVK